MLLVIRFTEFLTTQPSFFFQAISPLDMESMHQFLMARYQVSDFDDYKHLLALLRNTRAIAAHKASSRSADIRHLQAMVENARSDLVEQLQQGRNI
jgi:hypothetical protein